MNGAAITRPCTACKKPHISVAPGLCPECEKDSVFYKATRKKGDPREFLPYPELLEQWRRRRAECREWKKAGAEFVARWATLQQAEREKSYLLAALNALNVDLDPVAFIAAELDKARAEITQLELRLNCSHSIIERLEGRLAGKPEPWETALESLRAIKGKAAFPPDMWRRLVQLAHPDKHGDSLTATEATRWLMENRP